MTENLPRPARPHDEAFARTEIDPADSVYEHRESDGSMLVVPWGCNFGDELAGGGQYVICGNPANLEEHR